MANYNHLLYDTLEKKFSENSDIIGIQEWSNFIEAVFDSNEEFWDVSVFESWRKIRDIGLLSEPRKCPRIVVSHRRVDGAEAESIAYIACKSNFEYWLDIHDPDLLKLSKKAHLTEMQRKWLTAGIIEMALINCTHVITVMTSNASGSEWIPYEYGRITDIPMNISRAGLWLDPGYFKANIPDYMLLGIITQSEPEIKNWLSGEMLAWKSTYGLSEIVCWCNWGKSVPAKLPDPSDS